MNDSPWVALVRDEKMSLWELEGPDVASVRIALRALRVPWCVVTTRDGYDAGYIVACGRNLVYRSLEDAASRLGGVVVTIRYGSTSHVRIIFPQFLLRRPHLVDVDAIADGVAETAEEIFRHEEERLLWEECDDPTDAQIYDSGYSERPLSAKADPGLPDDLPF